MSTRFPPQLLFHRLVPCLCVFGCAVPSVRAAPLPEPPPLIPESKVELAELPRLEPKKEAQILDRRRVFDRMSGRWHLHASMRRVGTERTLEYDGVMVGRFLAGTSFFQMETETFLADGRRVSSTSVQIYDSGSETYRMIENLSDKMMVEMVGRVSGDEIIWKPMHGISYEVAENVIRFVNDNEMESRTELQETADSPKIVVVTQFKRVKDDFTPLPPNPNPPVPPVVPTPSVGAK